MRFESYFWKHATVALIATLLMQSCTTSVVVEGTVPTPLVSEIPARIGVYYSDDFRNYRHEETMRDAGSWDIDLGRQNMIFFRNLMDSLFEHVVEIDEPPVSAQSMLDLDGILIPEVEKYGFLTPGISGLKFYSASIEYRIVMFDKSGDKIGDWSIVGYGKGEGGMFSADEAINESTVLAIRDAGARIAIELIDLPAVQQWIESIRGVIPESSDDKSSESSDDKNKITGVFSRPVPNAGPDSGPAQRKTTRRESPHRDSTYKEFAHA